MNIINKNKFKIFIYFLKHSFSIQLEPNTIQKVFANINNYINFDYNIIHSIKKEEEN